MRHSAAHNGVAICSFAFNDRFLSTSMHDSSPDRASKNNVPRKSPHAVALGFLTASYPVPDPPNVAACGGRMAGVRSSAAARPGRGLRTRPADSSLSCTRRREPASIGEARRGGADRNLARAVPRAVHGDNSKLDLGLLYLLCRVLLVSRPPHLRCRIETPLAYEASSTHPANKSWPRVLACAPAPRTALAVTLATHTGRLGGGHGFVCGAGGSSIAKGRAASPGTDPASSPPDFTGLLDLNRG